jgi:hypothetical protein
MRWALPDRVFFACGACHILAYAFLERHGNCRPKVIWLKPTPGFTGNHIFIDGGEWVFDYHGYSDRERFLAHTNKKASRWWFGWRASLVELPPDVLISEEKSRTYDGLWLREPRQFLHDALPRARSYLSRFPAPAPQLTLQNSGYMQYMTGGPRLTLWTANPLNPLDRYR